MIFTALLIVLAILNNSYAKGNEKSPVSAKLISAQADISPGQEFYVGILLKMEDEWHTYWRNPGDAGLATTVDWELPAGFTAGDILWPLPEKDVTSDVVSYYYDDEVALLTKIKAPEDIPEKIEIKGKVKWLMCKEKCIPGSEEVSLFLVDGPEARKVSKRHVKMIENSLKSLPVQPDGMKFKAYREDKKILLRIDTDTDILPHVQFYPYNGGIYDDTAGQPKINIEEQKYLSIPMRDLRLEEPERLSGILVVDQPAKGKKYSIEIDVPIQENM